MLKFTNIKPNKTIAKSGNTVARQNGIIAKHFYQKINLMSEAQIAKLRVTPNQFLSLIYEGSLKNLLDVLKYHPHLVNETTDAGKSPLIAAIGKARTLNSVKTVEALLAADADPDLKIYYLYGNSNLQSVREWLVAQLASKEDPIYQKCLNCILEHDKKSMRVTNKLFEETPPRQESPPIETSYEVSPLNGDIQVFDGYRFLNEPQEGYFNAPISFSIQSIEPTPSFLNLRNSSSTQHHAKSDEQTINIHDSTDFFNPTRVFKH